ncbi:MAG: Ribonuclease R [Candidatus Heimdallarchaeota archaeon LC_2]|nr:MAG: Ribonuclease R [Candidatus Heimdallarchaeota archaeon LC_2]
MNFYLGYNRSNNMYVCYFPIVAKTGELVEFKPGLFNIEIPNNYGIFVKSFKKKNSKDRFVVLITVKGKQETKQQNVMKRKFGEFIQLKGNTLPPINEVTQQLNNLITRVVIRKDKVAKVEETIGELNERGIWKKLINSTFYDPKKDYSLDKLAFIWYGLPENEISKSRMKKMKLLLETCRAYGKGYFDISGKNWKPITDEMRKEIGGEMNILGSIRNNMFHMIEVPVEDSEDPEDTEIIRAPKDWENIKLSKDEIDRFEKLKPVMAYFVLKDTWMEIGIGTTHVYDLDGFSLRSYMSSLAEDWVNEGRTSYADAFVKLLIRVGYWNDSEALMAISKRVIHLAQHFNWETDERIEDIASRFKEPKETPDIFEGRTDLQHLEAYTIDPPTAKDFDDAISLETKNDGYVLWVHIADVAHYVEKDSTLDIHARGRSTSVYLPTKTIPMLPTHLSDNLCSLNEQLPRLAMTAEIHYDKKGNKQLNKCKIHNSVINVDKNLSYDQVNDALDDKQEPFLSLFKFSELLRTHRRGLNLETDDVRLELEEKMSVSIKSSSKSTKMIEAFMVSANETVAEILEKKELPNIFRDHPLPDKINVERLNAHAKVLGLEINIEMPSLTEDDETSEEEGSGSSLMDMISSGSGGNISFSFGGDSDMADQLKQQLNIDSTEDDEEVLLPTITGLAQLSEEKREEILKPFTEAISYVEKIENINDQKIAYLTILRALSRAFYSANNYGHFGLGSISYSHFTSPIRRYPDVITHRICKAMIANEDHSYDAEELENIAVHCNEQFEIADKLEKTVVGSGFSFLTRNPKYSENKLGIVSSITGGTVYVMLPNGIEARVPLSKISTRATFVDEHACMCFVGFKSTDQIIEEVTVDNWRDLLEDEDSNEPIEILLKLGDQMAINFVSWDHIQGRVIGAPSL